ncbi:MAG: carboxypeptidase-like regulatory domain-containing protein, partial [Flavobacteriales bacterium]
MLRFKWVCLFSFVLIQGLYAQNEAVETKGKIADEKGHPIAFASVFIVRDTAGAPLAGAVSDSTGVFTLKCAQRGTVSLVVKCLGYQTYKKRIALGKGGAVDMGTLVLKPLEQKLSGVAVVKRRPLVEQKIDRLVFHAADVVGAEGGD